MMNLILKKNMETALVIIFFAVFMLCLSKPIVDPDVFWHLKTGEWIWQNKTLPDKDPFSFIQEPSQYETTARATFILKQYWLAQLIMYGFYHLGGFYGIVAFRCLIYLLIGLILYYWMGRKGVSRINRLVFLMPMVYFSSQWLGERPNNLSFLFAVIVVYLLEDLKKSLNSLNGLNRLKLVSLPLVMLLWANMHGGFILGNAIIGVYMISEVLILLHRKIRNQNLSEIKLQVSRLKSFFFICLIAVFASFINPGTYGVFNILLGLSKGEYSGIPITEHLSPFYYASSGRYRLLVFIGIMITPLLLKIKRLKFHAILLIVFLVVLSLDGVRYIPFFVFITTPFISEIWGRSFDNVLRKTEKFYIPSLLMLCISVFLVVSNMKYSVFKAKIVSPVYPADTVKFIKTEKPEGEILNDMVFGGYLIWSLYPDYKVFIDGRRLFMEMETTYLNTMLGREIDINGIPLWRAVFNKYRVNAVILPSVNIIGGGFIRLVRRLVEDDEWSLVFIDKDALLFIKNTEKNREIIRKYAKPKIVAYGKALEQAEFYRADNPDDWRAYATLGEINLYLGSPRSALVNFEDALKLNPLLMSTGFGRLIEELRAGRDYSKLLDSVFR